MLWKRLLPVLLLALGTSGGAPERQANAANGRLVGTWELVSTEDRMTDGSRRPYPDAGPRGKGYLIYTADGHMCAELMNPDRPSWKDATNPSAVEKVSAFDTFSAYCGRYEVEGSQNVIYHYPEVAWQPSWVGTKQRRPYRLEGDLLTFSDAIKNEPGVTSYVIVWRRVKASR